MSINDRQIDLTQGRKFHGTGSDPLEIRRIPWLLHVLTLDTTLYNPYKSYPDYLSREVGALVRTTSDGKIKRLFQEYDAHDEMVTESILADVTGHTVDNTCVVCPSCGRVDFRPWSLWEPCRCYERNKRYSETFSKLFHNNCDRMLHILPEKHVPWVDFIRDWKGRVRRMWGSAINIR